MEINTVEQFTQWATSSEAFEEFKRSGFFNSIDVASILESSQAAIIAMLEDEIASPYEYQRTNAEGWVIKRDVAYNIARRLGAIMNFEEIDTIMKEFRCYLERVIRNRGLDRIYKADPDQLSALRRAIDTAVRNLKRDYWKIMKGEGK